VITVAAHIAFWGSATALFAVNAVAQPVFGSSFILNDQKIFPDKKKKNLYYYLPPGYKMLSETGGKPYFSLVKMRYTGTAATGDAGSVRYSNLLQFRVGIDKDQQKKITDVKAALRRQYPGSELQILPVRKFISLLVFAPASPEPGTDTVSLVTTGVAEASDENAAVSNSYWNERTVSVRLSNIDAQLLESALQTGRSLMSFAYAFYSAFAERPDLRTEVYGNPALRKEVKAKFDRDALTGPDTSLFLTPVKADAFPLTADITQWPSVIQEIDINERMPARYPLFDVYCYDFAQGLRADLWEKKIEIRATAVNGSDIQAGFSFRDDCPDIYARPIRFAYAVRFDRPFFYRVIEITHDGEKNTTDWIQKTTWSDLLDITTTPDKVQLKVKPVE